MSKPIVIIAGAIFFLAVIFMISITVLVFRNSATELGLGGINVASPASSPNEASPAGVTNETPSSADKDATDTVQRETPETKAKNIPKEKLTPQQKIDIAQYAIGILRGESSSEVITQTALLIENESGIGTLVTSLNLNDPRFRSVYKWHCTFFAKSAREFTAEVKLEEYHERRNLAFFRIEHEDLPTAVEWRQKVNLTEKSKLLAFGCRSSLTAQITQNDYPIYMESTSVNFIPLNALEYGLEIYLTNKLQPEMFGGPVVNEESDLVGIIATTKPGAKSGSMLTVHGIRQFLTARARNIVIQNTWQTADQRGYTLSFSANNSDNAIKKAQVIGFDGLPTVYPNEDGTWNLIAQQVAFSHQFEVTETENRFQFSCPHFDGEMVTQLLLTLRDGTEWCSNPIQLSHQKSKIGTFSDPSPPSDSKSITHLQLPATYSRFCFNAARGDIAALNPGHPGIVLFKASHLTARDLLKPVVLQLHAAPRAILLKQWNGKDHYIVSYISSHQIDVFEADTLKFVKKFEISVEGANVLASSVNDDNPIVYCLGDDRSTPEKLHAFDLTSQIDLGEVVNGFFRDVAFSEINSSLFLSGHASELSRVSAVRSPSANRPTFGYPDKLGIHGEVIQLDPNGNFVGAKSNIYSLEKKQRVATLSGTVGCFLKSKPIVLFYASDSFRIYSTESFEMVGKELKLFDLSETQYLSLRSTFPHGLEGAPVHPFIFADEANGRFIIAKGSTLLLVPFTAFAIPNASTDLETTSQ